MPQVLEDRVLEVVMEVMVEVAAVEGPGQLKGGRPQKRNPLWPCPAKTPCRGYILRNTIKSSTSKRHWGTGENTKLCGICEGGTGSSPSVVVSLDKFDFCLFRA